MGPFEDGFASNHIHMENHIRTSAGRDDDASLGFLFIHVYDKTSFAVVNGWS